MLLQACLTALTLFSALVGANTEKVIFTAPSVITFGDARPNLVDLHLETLTPQRLSLRTSLPVDFPDAQHSQGVQSWYLLQGLKQGQRYEVRVCWPATQPTQFWIETYNITHVLDTPELIQDLAAYAEDRQVFLSSEGAEDRVESSASAQSALFLRIWSAADFFTPNKQYMQEPPPVDVDIILDPYLYNVVPQSLLPTAAYIVFLALGGWHLSGFIWKTLRGLIDDKQRLD
ncbi:hypothetical protein MBLNU459_g1732t1 [Dothideomycetes sp. NU459]